MAYQKMNTFIFKCLCRKKRKHSFNLRSKLEVTEVRFHLIRSTLGYQRRLATPHDDGTCLRALCVLAEVVSLERISGVKFESCGNFQGTRTGVPLTYVYPWYLLCFLGILWDYNPKYPLYRAFFRDFS